MNKVELFDKLTLLPALIKEKGESEQLAESAGFSVTRSIEKKYDDTLCVRRTYKNERSESVTAQFILDVAANYAPERFTIPSVSYNGNLRSDGTEPH